jgi:hypothetical protein
VQGRWALVSPCVGEGRLDGLAFRVQISKVGGSDQAVDSETC